MLEFTERNSARLAVAIGIFFLVAAIVGAVQNFSPVPFWDMWDGYMLFMVRVAKGDYAAWWTQHVDHRILFSNLLFWIDHKVFAGTLWFLIVGNYVLTLCIWLVMRKLATLIIVGADCTLRRNLVSGVMLGLLFCWIQNENLTWAFQSGMYAAILFPALAFWLYYHSEVQAGYMRHTLFGLALVTAVVAAGTMINGLAALPIMLVLGLVWKSTKTRVTIIAMIFAAVVTLYFRGFEAPNAQFIERGNLLHTVLHQPLGMGTFFLAHIGAPAGHAFHQSLSISIVVGIIFLGWLLWFIWSGLRSPFQHKAVYVVIAIALYTLMTGLGIAGARLGTGVEAAFTSRYMTNALVYWCCIVVLLIYRYGETIRFARFLLPILAVMPMMLIPNQVQAFKRDANALADKMAAALALELGVRDQAQIGYVFPWLDVAFILAKEPRDGNLSIFGNPLIKDASQSLGSIIRHRGIDCNGGIDAVTEILDERRFKRLSLWMVDPYTGVSPSAFYVMNSDRKVIGYGIGGYRSYGQGNYASPENGAAMAYVRSDELANTMILKGRDTNCEVAVSLKQP